MFAATDGEIALAAGDPRLLATIEPLAQSELDSLPTAKSIVERVAGAVERLLPDASIDAVARAMHMSSRTLQRRLEGDGVRFSELLDAVHAGCARRAVTETAESMASIAARLGFADLATFGRAFKRWTGRSPGVFRRDTTR